jgi:selenide, water dikinase
VYRWDESSALVQTVDFFTPVVDDPATFGAIAAANSLSDVYAMGGRPLTALAIAAFPQADLDEAAIRAIFLGGFGKLREAGVALLGGHTVQDKEIKFGYAVTGVVDPRAIWANAGARPGDELLLTKPIGTGIVATAIKFDRAPAESIAEATRSMLALNKDAAEALLSLPAGTVHACTDITGFGLVGHACEMALASSATLRLEIGAIPFISGALSLAPANRSGGMNTNEGHFGDGVRVEGTLPDAVRALLFDPQTSGGLLASIAPSQVESALTSLAQHGVRAVRIGRVDADGGVPIVLA